MDTQQLQTLLEVGKAITPVRDHKQLLHVIEKTIKTVFPYDHAGLFVIDKTGHYFTEILDEDVLPDSVQTPLTHANLPGPFEYHGHPPASWIYAQSPVICSLADQANLYPTDSPVRATYTLALDQGLRQLIGGPLVCNDQKIGFISFNSSRESAYTEAHIAFFKAITDQVALAVANMLANEEILQREWEKDALPKITQALEQPTLWAPDETSLLLAVSRAMATIRDRKELLATIFDQIKPVIPVDDTGILVLDSSGQYWQDWTNTDNYQGHQAATQLQQMGYDQWLPMDRLGEYTLTHTGIMTIAHFKEHYPEHPFGPVMWEAGLREMLYTPLVNGARKLGVLFFDAEQEGTYTEQHLRLFKPIADLIAAAVANILANEEILERKQEKTKLLAISEAITMARTPRQFLRLVYERVQRLFPFDDAGLFTLDATGQYHRDWVIDYEATDPSENFTRAGITGYIPHANTPIAAMMAAPTAALYSFEAITAQYPGHPQEEQMRQMGFKHLIAGPLLQGGQTIGLLCFLSKQADYFHENQLPLFRAIANQLTPVVANILANEEILDREREKSVLLSISEAIATVRSKEDILRLIIQKVKPLFKFYDCGILIINANNRYNDLTVLHPKIDNSPNNYVLQDRSYYDFGGIDFAGSHLEWVVSRIEQAQAPILFNWQADYTHFHDAPLLEDLRELGYSESLVSTLKIGGTVFGCFFINYMQLGQAPFISHTLFQNLTNQLSVAISNILANEEILEREREKTQLLTISEAISKVNKRGELLRVIYRQIQPIFKFDNAGLFVTDSEKDLFYEILDSEAWPDELQQQLTDQHLLGPWRLTRSNPDSWWMQEDIVIRDLAREAQFAKALVGETQFEAGLAYGLKHMIGGPLFANGKKIGAMCFNSTKEQFYTPAHRSMFKSISEQVGVALANILANKEILEREWEKGILLSVSAAIAKVQNQTQLLKAIYQKITPLFPHQDIGLFLVDEENDKHWELIDEGVLDHDFNQTAWQKFGKGPFKHQGSGVDLLMNGPLILTMEELNNCSHPYIPVMKELGLKEFLGGPLLVNGKKQGMFSFNAVQVNTYSKKDFPLFQGILDQLSVALANILANEEILEREREKTLLLNISNSIAKINHKADLLKSINELLWPLFHHDDACFCVVDKEKQYFTDYYRLYSAEILNSSEAPDTQGVIDKPMYKKNNPRLAFPGSFVEHAMNHSPAVGKLEDIIPLTVHAPLVKSDIEAGLVYYLSSPLNVGGKSLGLFMLDFKEQNKPTATALRLFAQIAEMMAIAMANILANEEIVEREREKSHLLEISQAIAQVQNAKQLLRLIYEHIKPVFPYDNAGLYVFDQAGENYWGLLDPEVLPDETQIELERANLLGPYAYKGHHPDLWGYAETAAIYSRSAQGLLFADGSKERASNDIIVASGLTQLIGGPLYCAGRKIGLLCFNAKQADFYTAKHIPLYNAIADQIAVALANIVANAEILRREHEKGVLLSISEAIATVRGKEMLLTLILERIKPLFNFCDCGLFVFDADKRYLEDLTVSFPDIFPSGLNERLAGINAAKFLIAGSPWESQLQRLEAISEPVIHHYKDDKPANWEEYVQASFIDETGYQESLMSLLKIGGETIGVFVINALENGTFRAEQFHIFQAITDQIAVALANILANEEVLQRESEKALQLAVINALTDGSNWEQKMLALARALQPHVPFDYVTLGLVTEGQSRHSHTFYQTGYQEYETLHPAELMKLCGLSPERYQKLSEQPDVSRSLRLNGTEFEHYCRQDELKRIVSQTFRLQSHLMTPVRLTRNGCLLLSFYCRQPDAYLDRHLELLSKLRQSIALTLDRLLAYEEVEALSKQLQQENTYLQEEVRTNYSFEAIVGTSQAIRDVFQKVSLVGPMTSTVLILGETGTGKELVARAIHQSSPRRAKALIKVNCAALPAQLIESELFGHERGAFTGAIERRIGKFELAHESTIFLDEIGELPLELQAKLLRAIQEREIERLGSNKVIQVDVRVLAATNRNLEKEVADGRFRSDLYFRLNVYPIKLPPLRERREDIPLLAVHFSQKLAKKLGKPITGLSNGAINEMQSYHWPGNIRELEHVIERGVIESVGGTIKSLALFKQPEETPAVTINPAFQLKSYADGERELLINTLRYCNGRIRGAGGAAEILNVKATTLDARMKKLGIKREFFVTESASLPVG